MSQRWPRIRRALPALATAVVIAAAAVVWHHLPAPTDIYAPFDVHATIGTPAAGRAVTTTVGAVRITPNVTASSRNTSPPPVAAGGLWAVIDATVEATLASEIPPRS